MQCHPERSPPQRTESKDLRFGIPIHRANVRIALRGSLRAIPAPGYFSSAAKDHSFSCLLP
jgi:hypothetical protein